MRTSQVRRGFRLRRPLALAALVLTAAGCYAQTPPPRSAKLRVLAEPSTTTVYVDDLYVGSARVLAARPKELDPGIKRVTFKAPEHFPHDVQVDLPIGTTTIKMKLRPIPK